MEVTVDNFSKAFQILEGKIESADFIAVDGEFTGLSAFREGAPSYETLEKVYEKARNGTGKMMLVQYGICLFVWKEELNEYEAVPFSFFIFPRPYKKFGNDIVFTAQSSSINFLAENGFDFNKLFQKGVSFMNPREERIAQQNIDRDIEHAMEKEKQSVMNVVPAAESEASKVFIPKDQREFITGVCDMVKSFVQGDSSDALDLPPCTAFQRKLIYEKVEEMYPLGLYLESATNAAEDKFIRVHKTVTGYKKNIEEKFATEKQQLQDRVGFINVMRLLTKSRNPIIGHNMFKDLLLTYSNFFGELPPTFREYKESVHELFPTVFDSKVLATVPPMSNVLTNSSVDKLVREINEGNLPDPCTKMSAKLQNEEGFSERFHDAGYDAFSTGRIFISLSKHISSHAGSPVSRIDVTSDILSGYANKIYINRIRDVFSCNLCGEDVTPDRRNVFFVQFPSGWKTDNIKQLFVAYTSSSWVNWINDTSAFVTIEEEKYDQIYKNLVIESAAGEGVSVLPYNHYIRGIDPKSLQADADPPPGKRQRTETESDKEDGELESDSE